MQQKPSQQGSESCLEGDFGTFNALLCVFFDGDSSSHV